MWLFSRPKLSDESVFGPLKFHSRYSEWTGRFPYEANRTVELNVCAGPDGPTPSQITLFVELRDRYPLLIGLLKNELLRIYSDEPIEMQLDHPMPQNADDLWSKVVFDYVTIHDEGHSPELAFAFSVPWDDEHGRYLEIANWKVVDVNM